MTDDLQIHTLELTKLAVVRENLKDATPAECWGYFLRHASCMTVEEVQELFPAPEFLEAAGVLELISQTPRQLHESRARLKLRLDGDARIQYARQEGELLGRIAILQELQSESTPTREEMLGYDLAQLTTFCDQLQQRLRDRV